MTKNQTVVHLLPDSGSFNTLWLTFLNETWRRKETKIKQLFTYYLIQGHLILYDSHSWMRHEEEMTKNQTVVHLLPDSGSSNTLWLTFLNETWRRKETKIKQFFTYYLIQRHLIVYDWHFPMTWKSYKVIYPNKYLQDMSIDGWTKVTNLRSLYTLVT